MAIREHLGCGAGRESACGTTVGKARRRHYAQLVPTWWSGRRPATRHGDRPGVQQHGGRGEAGLHGHRLIRWFGGLSGRCTCALREASGHVVPGVRVVVVVTVAFRPVVTIDTGVFAGTAVFVGTGAAIGWELLLIGTSRVQCHWAMSWRLQLLLQVR